MGRKRDIQRNIEKGLGGAGRLKILRLLLRSPEHAFTRYEIVKTVPNGPVSIRNDLKTLVQINWVTPFNVQNLNKYAINREHEVVQRLADFLQDIRYL